ncbi:glucosamine-6-phosphate isomerase/6-phosphogluconolactonase [Fragilaria crotonensis]|nr:glucosamine-6-phosphate isomerase/6-phosphogluconolactonase [Fragilaria crotonensis]
MNLVLLLITITSACAFVPPQLAPITTSTSGNSMRSVLLYATAPAPVDNVVVMEDANAVGAKIKEIVEQAAAAAIADKGHFWLAIPGGSILKMLVGSNGDWTSQTTIAYVNHKCVPMDDLDLATHAKAMKLFMNEWDGCHPIVLDGTDDGDAEAASYQLKLDNVPRSDTGIPQFDLALIGVGDDGHVGSLYPNRDEVLETQKWVLSVAMKSPPSISLSLPIMANAKQVVVAACGVSDKYPQGKSDAMRRAIVEQEETLQSFPAVGLRQKATWIMDKAAASKLGGDYN